MTSAELKTESFKRYPQQARALAEEHIALLRRLPLAFLPLLLRELVAYDWKFAVEQQELQHQFAYLQAHPDATAAFDSIRVPAELQSLDWVNNPVQFSEQLSASLWASHQIDPFRAAAVDYVARVDAAATPAVNPVPRLSMVALGRGVHGNTYPLFRKLRRHGVYYSSVQPEGGCSAMLEAVARRASEFPEPHAHWVLDGETTPPMNPRVTTVSYSALAPARQNLQRRMRSAFDSGTGSEALRTLLAKLRPEELGLQSGNATLDRFALSLLTEASGTQIYSTTFVQWGAREALRRAQPVTLLAHFTPRQKESSMRELLDEAAQKAATDAAGSLVDADMGAYYTWLNAQRLLGAEQSGFLAWFEDQHQAVVVAPGFSANTSDSSPISVAQLIRKIEHAKTTAAAPIAGSADRSQQ